jgi:ribulose 1,5-bisphosphate synthetase/thiazole synthase
MAIWTGHGISEVERQVPIKEQVDVLVVGGGSAGVTAAIAAARLGAKTLVVERYGFLGGLITGGPTGLHTFFNCYHDENGSPNVPAARKKQLIRGLPQEIIDRLQKAGGGLGHIELELSKRFVSVLSAVDPEIYKWLAMEMTLEAGAQVYLHSYVSDVIMDGDIVKGVIIESKSGREAILAKVIVDTSGDADVAARAGAPYKFIEQFGVSMNLRMVGVDVDGFAAAMVEKGLVRQLGHGVKLGATRPSVVRVGAGLAPWQGQIERYGAGIRGILSTSVREGDLTHMNCTGITVNGVDVRDMTKASIHLHRQIHNIAAFFHDCVPGFEKAYLVATGPLLGVRRTRLMESRYDIPRDHVLKGEGAPDEIGRFGFIDIADYEIENAGSYGIPYRSLLPQKVEGVLIAGRSMSTDHVVHHSTRNVGCCLLTGEAAGTAAALAARENVASSKLDAQLLRRALAEREVYFE